MKWLTIFLALCVTGQVADKLSGVEPYAYALRSPKHGIGMPRHRWDVDSKDALDMLDKINELSKKVHWGGRFEKGKLVWCPCRAYIVPYEEEWFNTRATNCIDPGPFIETEVSWEGRKSESGRALLEIKNLFKNALMANAWRNHSFGTFGSNEFTLVMRVDDWQIEWTVQQSETTSAEEVAK